MERHWHSGFTQWLFAAISVRTLIGILQKTASCLSGGTILSPANKQVKIIACTVLRHGVTTCGVGMAASGILMTCKRVMKGSTFVPKRQNIPIGVFRIETGSLPIRHQADFYVRQNIARYLLSRPK